MDSTPTNNTTDNAEVSMLETYSRLMDTLAGNQRLLDIIAFEEACVHKLKRGCMSTLLHRSPLDSKFQDNVDLDPCPIGVAASDIDANVRRCSPPSEGVACQSRL
jgi:hypothetical protein